MEEISEEKLEQIITTIEENITLHDCRNENCEAYWIVENRQQVKTWIQEIIVGGLTYKQEDLILETAREKYMRLNDKDKGKTHIPVSSSSNIPLILSINQNKNRR